MHSPSPWRRRAALALTVLALTACAAPTDRPAAPTALTAAVDGGRMAFVLQGQADDGAAPTVVFQSGLGDDHRTWSAVLQQLPGQFQAIAPDRPGYGDSPPRGDVRDACRIAQEQRTLLRRAGMAPPYVLVGHSLGGWYQYVYARLYPEDVAGLVLLDPTHPGTQAALAERHPAAASLLQLARNTVFTPAMAQEFDAQSACLERVEQQAPLAAPALLLASTDTPVYYGAALRETLETLRQDWLRRSGAALSRVAGSGHRIQQDAPAAVVQAIEALARPVGAL
ncbi:alpha/beta fold hydrolase [Pseudorhodoferax sp.]|uniref:alpha/beta fold hydrolase n=1 Tax=Pseudorhodoferax sp. TaxID=1993553 RepID=UPI002DD67929|nr:alpha/beta hydrolase [Pseudorhodoferax sp.]